VSPHRRDGLRASGVSSISSVFIVFLAAAARPAANTLAQRGAGAILNVQ